MNNEELAALIELAQRAPKTNAEALWLASIIQRLTTPPAPVQEGQAG